MSDLALIFFAVISMFFLFFYFKKPKVIEAKTLVQHRVYKYKEASQPRISVEYVGKTLDEKLYSFRIIDHNNNGMRLKLTEEQVRNLIIEPRWRRR